MVDHLAALVDLLAAVTAVSDLVGTRVFGGGLPRDETDSMPRQCIVVKYSGNPGGPGSADFSRLAEFRVDTLCYGETPWKADQVRRAVHDAMKAISRSVQGSVLFHRANWSGGPIQALDQDTDWPFCFESWDVLAAEVAVS